MGKSDVNSSIIKYLKADFETGFRMLFIEYYKPMTRAALKLVFEQYAEDIVQDIFLYIWNNKVEFQNELSIKSYLYSSIYNKCISQIRKHKTEARYANNIGIQHFYQSVLDEDVYSILLKEVAKLPDHYRVAVELTLDGNSNQDIATHLNVSEDAIKSYKKRAKTMLKKKLSNISYIIIF